MKQIQIENLQFLSRFLNLRSSKAPIFLCLLLVVGFIIFYSSVSIMVNLVRFIGNDTAGNDQTVVEPMSIIETKNYEMLQIERAQKLDYNFILYWTGYPGYDTTDNRLRRPQYCYKQYPKCRVTTNRVYLKHSNVIIFNWHKFNQNDLPSTRSANQLWVLYNLEPPFNLKRLPEDSKVIFNLTATYRSDSSIVQTYGIVTRRAIPLPDSDPSLKVNLRQKSKMIAWFVSHCETPSRREEYAKQLSFYIEIDIFGKCGPFICYKLGKVDCYKLAAQKYLFYLSFENSFCKDYVTEKLFNIMSYDMVPVVYGGVNYSSILPPNSYIDASTMKPDQLAKLLLNIASDQIKYRSYFAWRKYYVLDRRNYPQLLYCKLCQQSIQMEPNRNHRSFTAKEINSWYIDGACNVTKPGLLLDNKS